ncbi:hypothetical protein N9R43_00950 [bacterium]|nr:hypothetical protein [bacterium]
MSNNDKDRTIVLLGDFLEQRVRKDNEIKWYEEQLQDIERRLFFLRKEHELTTTIIEIIQNEKVYDVKDTMEKKFMEDDNPLLIRPRKDPPDE